MCFILTSGGKCGRPREQLLLLVRYLGVERQTAASRALRLRFALRDSHRCQFRRCSAGNCRNKQYKLKIMFQTLFSVYNRVFVLLYWAAFEFWLSDTTFACQLKSNHFNLFEQIRFDMKIVLINCRDTQMRREVVTQITMTNDRLEKFGCYDVISFATHLIL